MRAEDGLRMVPRTSGSVWTEHEGITEQEAGKGSMAVFEGTINGADQIVLGTMTMDIEALETNSLDSLGFWTLRASSTLMLTLGWVSAQPSHSHLAGYAGGQLNMPPVAVVHVLKKLLVPCKSCLT